MQERIQLKKKERKGKEERITSAYSLQQIGVEKAISIPYSYCVYVALVIHHAKRMRRTI